MKNFATAMALVLMAGTTLGAASPALAQAKPKVEKPVPPKLSKPILAIVMTFSIIFTFTDFQLVYAITRGGPVNSTHLMATLAFQRGIPGGQLAEGAAIAVAMIPFLIFATLVTYYGMARRKWQQGEAND